MDDTRDSMGRTPDEVDAVKAAAKLYPIHLRTDCFVAAAPIVAALERWGFEDIRLERLRDEEAVPRIHAGAAAARKDTLLAEVFGAVAITVMNLSGCTINFVDFAHLADDDPRILIDLPAEALENDELLDWLDAMLDSVA